MRFVVGLATLLLLGPAFAQQIDDATFNSGLRVYREFGQCWDCHGWAGTGGLPRVGSDRNAGPPLINTKLDRAAMIEVVSCGKPGSDMPAFARDAWKPARRCYGKTAADLPPGQEIAPQQTTLTEGQVAAVVAFVQAFYQGKTMTKANCLRYFGVTSTVVCDQFP